MSQGQAREPHTPIPYDRLLALPENLAGEIIDGVLHTQPWPAGRHAIAERGLNIDLGGPFDFERGGSEGWWIISEPEVHFLWGTGVVVPDLAGWR
jgi:hypothetical protein